MLLGKVTGVFIVGDYQEKGKHQLFLNVDFTSTGLYAYSPAYMFQKV
jgi:hypothetical protein